MATDEILYLGVKRDYEAELWVICEEHVKFYRVLGSFENITDARCFLAAIRGRDEYAHLDKDGFASSVLAALQP